MASTARRVVGPAKDSPCRAKPVTGPRYAESVRTSNDDAFENAFVQPAGQPRAVYAPQIFSFYHEEQVPPVHSHQVSQSPLKPRYFMNHLRSTPFAKHIRIEENWGPLHRDDFLIAHTPEYVSAFFRGISPLRSSNGIGWSPEFAESVRFNNASLYNAIRSSIQQPSRICLSPTSGFHHARPSGGGGFCTFSGQVIASVKIFRELGLRGAYLDLDAHYGNSIEDSREYVPDLNLAVPRGFNMNPAGAHDNFMRSLRDLLKHLKPALLDNEIQYVVFCHGADSHHLDDLGCQCTTEEWLECSRLVYTMLAEVAEQMERPVPLSLSLFGGYRADDYDSVLNLHAGDLAICLNTLCGHAIEYEVRVKKQ